MALGNPCCRGGQLRILRVARCFSLRDQLIPPVRIVLQTAKAKRYRYVSLTRHGIKLASRYAEFDALLPDDRDWVYRK
jgi:hypothetical protein